MYFYLIILVELMILFLFVKLVYSQMTRPHTNVLPIGFPYFCTLLGLHTLLLNTHILILSCILYFMNDLKKNHSIFQYEHNSKVHYVAEAYRRY